MSDDKPRLRDVYRYNDSFNAMEVSTADRRFEQLIERKERLVERSRFGILALNGASAIGIVSAYQGLQAEFGTDPRSALMFFAAGMILALVSIFFETIFVGARAAHMFGHLSSLRAMRATLDNDLTERNEKIFDEQMKQLEELSKRPNTKIKLDNSKDGLPNDFAYSPVALFALNAAGGAWISGVLMMMYALLK